MVLSAGGYAFEYGGFIWLSGKKGGSPGEIALKEWDVCGIVSDRPFL